MVAPRHGAMYGSSLGQSLAELSASMLCTVWRKAIRFGLSPLFTLCLISKKTVNKVEIVETTLEFKFSGSIENWGLVESFQFE